jgi:ferritin
MKKSSNQIQKKVRLLMEKNNIPNNPGIENIKKTVKPVSESSPIKPNKLPEEIVQILENRIGDEYAAHYLYNCAHNWCLDKNYKKAAQFFKGEAEAELEHARKLQDFITQWNIKPRIHQVETNREFSSLVDVINKSYKIEYDLYRAYLDDSKKIFLKDMAVFDFLSEFRKIQTDSVAEFSDLLNALDLINVNNPLDILYFEQAYF